MFSLDSAESIEGWSVVPVNRTGQISGGIEFHRRVLAGYNKLFIATSTQEVGCRRFLESLPLSWGISSFGRAQDLQF